MFGTKQDQHLRNGKSRAPSWGQPLDRHALKMMLYRRTEAAGIGKRGPHTFIRTFAAQDAVNEVPLVKAMAQGNRVDPKMAIHYQRTVNAEMYRIHLPKYA